MGDVLKQLTAWERVESIIDEDDEFNPIYDGLSPKNILSIPGYDEKLKNAQDLTKLEDSILTGIGIVNGITCVIGAMDYRFLSGSLGMVSGEKISELIEIAGKGGYPLIIFCCSGGARMQEGIYALMQMSKIATTLNIYKSQIPVFISVLTDPTMGGVTASIGMLGDIILAEPHARIGFAGPKIFANTLGVELPENFQTAEFQLENGFIDDIVERKDLKEEIGKILKYSKYKVISNQTSRPIFNFNNNPLDVWQKIKSIRSPDRLDSKDYIKRLFTNFIELHGDRLSGDDPTIFGGLAQFRDIPVTVIGITRGSNIQDIIKNKFGMTSPAGYRKAMRLMRLSSTRPIIIFINTPGACPGYEAEKAGQAVTIANCLSEMAKITAPTLTIITGEGGSGGALALATSNQVWMLENAVYSVVSPEGFASIILKDSSKAEEAANLMKMTANDLLSANIIDGIIPEHGGATLDHLDDITKDISAVIDNFIRSYHGVSGINIVQQKVEKFKKY